MGSTHGDRNETSPATNAILRERVSIIYMLFVYAMWYSANMQKIHKTDEEWRKELSSELYRIARKKGTEAPFTGAYYKTKDTGMYVCAACGQELFSSDTKYDSGSGWPSFTAPVGEDVVETQQDPSYGVERTEVTCGRCGAHVGHVFDDGPQETGGKRFCINSASLNLKRERAA